MKSDTFRAAASGCGFNRSNRAFAGHLNAWYWREQTFDVSAETFLESTLSFANSEHHSTQLPVTVARW
jgi:hypothetical protein